MHPGQGQTEGVADTILEGGEDQLAGVLGELMLMESSELENRCLCRGSMKGCLERVLPMQTQCGATGWAVRLIKGKGRRTVCAVVG